MPKFKGKELIDTNDELWYPKWVVSGWPDELGLSGPLNITKKDISLFKRIIKAGSYKKFIYLEMQRGLKAGIRKGEKLARLWKTV